MILLVSTCSERFSEEEFIRPITDILQDAGTRSEIVHYKDMDADKINKYSKVIICGTALKDDEYLGNLDMFSWLKSFDGKVLGICSGLQILGILYGASVEKRPEIGMTVIKTIKNNLLFSGEFEAYAMHNNHLIGLERQNHFDILAVSDTCTEAIKLNEKDFYGILFHPEARNKEIIKKFINI